MSKKHNPRVDQVVEYVRATLDELNGAYDSAALTLLFQHGAFCVDNPEKLHEAVQSLSERDEAADSERIVQLQEWAYAATTGLEDRRRAVIDLEQMQTEQANDLVEAAYLLGIAVGRRLGGGALALPRAKRRADASVSAGGVR